MTAEQAFMEMWLDLRNDARHAAIERAAACINFAYSCDLLTLEQRELWIRRITTCPGHDDEGGRAWCAYCGDMPREAL